jgi:outer membrane protein TolC
MVLPAKPVADKPAETTPSTATDPHDVNGSESFAKDPGVNTAAAEPLIPAVVEPVDLSAAAQPSPDTHDLAAEPDSDTMSAVTSEAAGYLTAAGSGVPLARWETAGSLINSETSTLLITTGEPLVEEGDVTPDAQLSPAAVPAMDVEPVPDVVDPDESAEEASIRAMLEAEGAVEAPHEDTSANVEPAASPAPAEADTTSTLIPASTEVDDKLVADLNTAMEGQLAEADDEDEDEGEDVAQYLGETGSAASTDENPVETTTNAAATRADDMDFTVADWVLDENTDAQTRIPEAVEVADITEMHPPSPDLNVNDGVTSPLQSLPMETTASAESAQSGAVLPDDEILSQRKSVEDPMEDPVENSEPTSAELAQIEAELNETLVLGPVAIAGETGADESASAEADGDTLLTASDVVAGAVDVIDAANATDEALPPPMPLLDALERALANNPEVGMALAREEQARWAVREAGAYRSPTLDLVTEAGPEYNRPATKTSDIEDVTPGRNLNIRLTKLLYDGGTSVAEEQRRQQIRRSTEIETRLVIEEIVVKAIKAYMQILQNQQAARVADDFVAEMKRMVDQINVMKESGAASKIELDFAKSRLASAIAQTGTTEAQLNDAIASLEFLTGDLPPFTAVAPMKANEIQVEPLELYSDRAHNNNAEVLLNGSNKTALALKLRGQMAQFKPILTLNMKSEALADEGGNLDPRNTTEAKIKLEYFILDGGVRKARIQRTKAQLVELDWDHERAVKDVNRRVKQSYNQITTNRLTLSATEDEIKANEELRRLNRKNLEIGDISILELIEVEERLFNSRANRDRIAAEMLRNYYELLIGTGDLPQVLSEDYVASRVAPLEE